MLDYSIFPVGIRGGTSRVYLLFRCRGERRGSLFPFSAREEFNATEIPRISCTDSDISRGGCLSKGPSLGEGAQRGKEGGGV